MKKIITGLIALMAIFGMASALPNWGPPNGFHSKLIDVDTLTADVITAGAAITDTGAIDIDTTWGAGYDINAATGAGHFDFSPSTGYFKTPSGENGLDGDTYLAANKAFAAIGGTGYFDVGRATGQTHLTQGTTYANATKVTTLGASGAAKLSSLTVNTTAAVSGYTTLTGSSNSGQSNVAGALKVATDATVGHLTTNNTVSIGTIARVGDSLKTNHLVVNGTSAHTGAANFGGATAFGGTATINASTALTVTTKDYLTVGGNIIANEMVLTFPFGFNSTNTTWFAANDGWVITKVEETHMTKQSSTAEPATIDLAICNSGEAPASGDTTITAPIDLRATNNVLQTATLSATKTLADGDWLAVVFRGYRTGFAGGCLTVHMKRS